MGNSTQTLLSLRSKMRNKTHEKARNTGSLTTMPKTLSTFVAIMLFSFGLTACAFKPLYGPTSTNQELQTVLAGIMVPEVPGRVGQRVRNELIFRFTGGGHPTDIQYKLILAVRESVTSQLVQRDGDSRGQIYQLKTEFKLFSVNNDKDPLLAGNSYSKAPFQDNDSVYANVRSRRNAEDRASKATAEDIQGRIAAFLSGNS